MNYNDAKEIYDDFIKETTKLQLEIKKLDNEVEKPFDELYKLIDVESLDFNAIDSFYEYRDKVSLEFVKVVQAHKLSVNNKYLYWHILPFGNDYLPYMYDGELGSLLDVLTEGDNTHSHYLYSTILKLISVRTWLVNSNIRYSKLILGLRITQ